MHKHVAAGNIDLVFKGQGNGLALASTLQFTIKSNNRFDPATLARGQHDELITLVHHTGRQCAGKASKVQVWPGDQLNREAQIREVTISRHFDGIKDFHQGLTGIPRATFATVDDVVALERGHWHKMHAVSVEHFQPAGKLTVVIADLIEYALIEILQVHLVHGHNDMLDTQ